MIEEIEPGNREHLRAARAALRVHGPPLWRATSARVDAGPAQLPKIRIADADLRRPYFARLLASERFGPALEVYRVPREPR